MLRIYMSVGVTQALTYALRARITGLRVPLILWCLNFLITLMMTTNLTNATTAVGKDPLQGGVAFSEIGVGVDIHGQCRTAVTSQILSEFQGNIVVRQPGHEGVPAMSLIRSFMVVRSP